MRSSPRQYIHCGVSRSSLGTLLVIRAILAESEAIGNKEVSLDWVTCSLVLSGSNTRILGLSSALATPGGPSSPCVATLATPLTNTKAHQDTPVGSAWHYVLGRRGEENQTSPKPLSRFFPLFCLHLKNCTTPPCITYL